MMACALSPLASERCYITADIGAVSEFPEASIVYDGKWMPLVSQSASPAVFYLAIMQLAATVAQDFLRQAHVRIESLYEPSVPDTWEGQRDGDQLSLFVDWSRSNVPNDPISETAICEAAEHLAEALKSIRPDSFSSFADAARILSRIHARVSVDGDDTESSEERAHQLLTVASEIERRFRKRHMYSDRSGFVAFHVIDWQSSIECEFYLGCGPDAKIEPWRDHVMRPTHLPETGA